MLIQVKVKNGKSVPYDVEPNITIDNLKIKFKEKEGIPPCLQKITRAGSQLQDSRTLSSYNLTKGSSNLELDIKPLHRCMRCAHYLGPLPLKMSISVRVYANPGKTVVAEVESTETIAEVKEKLFKLSGIASCLQRLICSGAQLIDDKTLSSYNIKEDSKFQLIPRTGHKCPKCDIKIVEKEKPLERPLEEPDVKECSILVKRQRLQPSYYVCTRCEMSFTDQGLHTQHVQLQDCKPVKETIAEMKRQAPPAARRSKRFAPSPGSDIHQDERKDNEQTKQQLTTVIESKPSEVTPTPAVSAPDVSTPVVSTPAPSTSEIPTPTSTSTANSSTKPDNEIEELKNKTKELTEEVANLKQAMEKQKKEFMAELDEKTRMIDQLKEEKKSLEAKLHSTKTNDQVTLAFSENSHDSTDVEIDNLEQKEQGGESKTKCVSENDGENVEGKKCVSENDGENVEGKDLKIESEVVKSEGVLENEVAKSEGVLENEVAKSEGVLENVGDKTEAEKVSESRLENEDVDMEDSATDKNGTVSSDSTKADENGTVNMDTTKADENGMDVEMNNHQQDENGISLSSEESRPTEVSDNSIPVEEEVPMDTSSSCGLDKLTQPVEQLADVAAV